MVGLITKDPQLQNCHLKLQKFIREHEAHATIQRLRNNEPITATDMAALESIVLGEGGQGSREDYEANYGTDKPLGELVRSITGLDQGAAKTAFAEFLEKAPLSADQINFVEMIVDHLVENGVMDPARLFEPPFSDVHPEGVIGVLPEYAEAIVAAVERVNANAVAA